MMTNPVIFAERIYHIMMSLSKVTTLRKLAVYVFVRAGSGTIPATWQRLNTGVSGVWPVVFTQPISLPLHLWMFVLQPLSYDLLDHAEPYPATTRSWAADSLSTIQRRFTVYAIRALTTPAV